MCAVGGMYIFCFDRISVWEALCTCRLHYQGTVIYDDARRDHLSCKGFLWGNLRQQGKLMLSVEINYTKLCLIKRNIFLQLNKKIQSSVSKWASLDISRAGNIGSGTQSQVLLEEFELQTHSEGKEGLWKIRRPTKTNKMFVQAFRMYCQHERVFYHEKRVETPLFLQYSEYFQVTDSSPHSIC